MDLGKFETKNADTGAEMKLLDFNGEPIEVVGKDGKKEGFVTIKLLGKDSQVHKKIDRRRQQDAINRAVKGKKASSPQIDKVTEQTLDDLVELTLDMGVLELDGKKIGSDKALIREAYKSYPFVKEQAFEFIEDRANFL